MTRARKLKDAHDDVHRLGLVDVPGLLPDDDADLHFEPDVLVTRQRDRIAVPGDGVRRLEDEYRAGSSMFSSVA